MEPTITTRQSGACLADTRHRTVGMAVLLILLALSASCSHAPDARDIHGAPLRFADSNSPWLIVTYWADWCGACRQEVPVLNALHSADNGIRVWGVDFDSSKAGANVATLKEKVKRLGIHFPIVAPESVIQLNIVPPPLLPTSYIVNGQGEVQKKLVGPRTRAQLERAVTLLQQRPDI